MGILSFVSKLGDSVSNTFSEIKNVLSGAGKEIGTQLNNVVNKGADLAKSALNTGKEIVEHTEDSFKSIISMPLLLIAAGVGGLLLFNGKDVVQTAGQVATRMPPV